MRTTFLVFVLLACSPPTFAQYQITYQGSLSQSGTPATGTKTLGFRLWDDLTQGALIETLGEYQVDLVDGLFTTILDTSNEFRRDLYLEIYVLDQGQTEVLSPRTRITASPRSVYSLNTRGLYVTAAGQVGVNEQRPDAQLQVNAFAGLGESLRLTNEGHFTEMQFTGDPAIYDIQVRDSDLDRPLSLGLNRDGGSIVVGDGGIRFDDSSVINSASTPRAAGIVGEATITVASQSVPAGASVPVSSGITGVQQGDVVIVNGWVPNPFVLSQVSEADAAITLIDNSFSGNSRQLPETTVRFIVIRP